VARRALSLFFLLLCLGMVGCDHATKHAASTLLPRSGAVEVVPGVFDLRYAENRDTAFSLLRRASFDGKGTVLAGAAVVALLLVSATWWRRRRGPALEQAAFALTVSGAIGNVLDRLFRGYVIDFLHIHRWPIFNVADVAIVAGLVLLGITSLRSRAGPAAPAVT
jgi:signal peptidase II